MSRVLTESTRLAQQGKISQGINALKRQWELQGQSYSVLSNLAAFHLQLGDVQKSIQFNSKAISLDPFSYVAYYNRFLCFFVQDKLKLAQGDLEKALSCLYLLRGYQQKNVKYLNKAIFYCEQNAKAYLIRAKLNEGKNNKLAENDYSIAIQYAPNLGEIYQQRALFYRRIGRIKQFEENFAAYFNLKAFGAKHTAQLVQNESSNTNIKEKIIEQVRQFQELLARKRPKEDVVPHEQKIISKLPLDSIHSTIQKKEDEQLLLSDRPDDIDTAKTIQIRKEQINFKKRDIDQKFNKNFQHIFQDQNSNELNEEIQKLQRQIKEQGGKLTLQDNQQLDVSDPSNFLTAEIQKAIEQITKLSNNKDALNDVKSVRSAKSNTSSKSKQSNNKQLSVDEFKKYNRINFQVISLDLIDNAPKKQPTKIVVRYKQGQYSTQLNSFLQWKQQFNMPLQSDVYQLQIEAKVGGVFKMSNSIGLGTINLLQVNQSKCILGSKDKKTAILYYKLKLIQTI